MTEARAYRIAVIGSGPAGAYAAFHLLGQSGGTLMDNRMVHLMPAPVEVDLFDRLPTPWGLVRNGIAPDHPERKRIANMFERLSNHERFRFFGNVEIGRDVRIEDLRAWYDAVILAHGTQGSRVLGIPGEEKQGVLAAREFVAWYNGHPDFADLCPDLSGERAIVIGNGNVALDVARILLRNPEDLAGTDIAQHALESLRQSQIREIVIAGRRGSLDSAFSLAELQELAELEDVSFRVDAVDELEENAVSAALPARRKLEFLRTLASSRGGAAAKQLRFLFNATPVAVEGKDRAETFLFHRRDASGTTVAEEQIEAGLMVTSIGYTGAALSGLPFDQIAGRIPSEDGRVLGPDGPLQGLYVTGWARRGPSGIVGTNRKCARDVVHSLAADLQRGLLPAKSLPDRSQLEAMLASRQPSIVSRDGWRAIDRAERQAGQAVSRPRVKLVRMNTLLEAAAAARGVDAPGLLPRFDVIVVGSGLGGLSSAACLAAVGKSVLVLEQHEIVGGCSQTFRRKNRWEFDCGVHYVGGCEPNSDGLISTVLRGLGVEDRVEWSRLDDAGMDTVLFPGHRFKVPTNWDGLIANLCDTYPRDADGLVRCIGELRRIGEGADRINDVPHSLSVLLPLMKRPAEAFAIARGLERPITDLFRRCRLSQEAGAALLALVHLHNTPPVKTPALLVAMLLQHYFKSGAYFPLHGGQVIAASLTEVIQSHGGRIRTKSSVRSIDIAAGRVTGVTLDNGEQFLADTVISNADIHRTFQNLIDPTHLTSRSIRRVERIRRPHSIFSIYLGADIDISKNHPATNFVLHDRYDIQTTYDLMDSGKWDPKGWIAVSSPTLKTWGKHSYGPKGHSSIEIFCSAPGDHAFWGGEDPLVSSSYKWNATYRDRKAEIEETIVARTLAALPELRGHIAWQESATPLTHERFTHSRMPYGPENAKDQIGPYRRHPARTEIEGLFLAGASTAYLYGIAFTLRGGVGTASEVLGRDLLKEFRAGHAIVDFSALPTRSDDWDPFDVCRGLSPNANQARDHRSAA